MKRVYESHVNTIWKGDALEVAAAEEPGSFSLAILDGPYGLQKSGWDMMRVDELAEWYQPFLAGVDRLCADDATMYVWNTGEGWGSLNESILARGWTFASLIVWDKVNSPGFISRRFNRQWVHVHEVCGMYTRGRPPFTVPPSCTGSNVWRLAARDFVSERFRTGGTVQRVANRPPEPEQLHPCQKPLAFADRIIRASSLPGQKVWVPFGGTCREAVAAEWMARADPEEARRVVTAELDLDGRNYLDAVVAQLEGRDVRRPNNPQVGLFA